MKGQRWKHIVVEEEKEEGVRNCEEMSLFIGREGKKKGVKVINAVKKYVF